ncbi:MAG: hypothetical protein ABSH56_22675 [Bryobacteraceae bacterium]|jgi:hypothetical protein
MIRAFGILGLGGSFLAISPKLRDDLFSGVHKLTGTLNEYSPYSYIAVALCLFGLITLSLYRSTGLRS